MALAPKKVKDQMLRYGGILLALVGCDAVVEEDQVAVGTDATSLAAPRVAGQGNNDSNRNNRSSGAECVVVLEDSLNEFTTVLTSEQRGSLVFEVTNESTLEQVDAKFADPDAPLETSAGVPYDTLNEIRWRYRDETRTFAELRVVEIDGQLTYRIVSGAECVTDEFALILFFVDEWYYFG